MQGSGFGVWGAGSGKEVLRVVFERDRAVVEWGLVLMGFRVWGVPTPKTIKWGCCFGKGTGVLVSAPPT